MPTGNSTRLRVASLALLLGALAGCQASSMTQPASAETRPAPQSTEAPSNFQVRFETTKGVMVMEVHRAWAPLGADRFYALVQSHYYDGSKFFRVSRNWEQFGIAADPAVAQAWRDKNIPDDPIATPQVSNTRGTVAFAFAKKDGRTTQVFINLHDNQATHDHPADGLPFVPFAQVIEGMDVADKINGEYGETAGGGIRAGKQDPVFAGGNAYLEKNFPRLDSIISVRIVP